MTLDCLPNMIDAMANMVFTRWIVGSAKDIFIMIRVEGLTKTVLWRLISLAALKYEMKEKTRQTMERMIYF